MPVFLSRGLKKCFDSSVSVKTNELNKVYQRTTKNDDANNNNRIISIRTEGKISFSFLKSINCEIMCNLYG